MRRSGINLMLALCLLAAGVSGCGGGQENSSGNSISGTVAVSTNGVGLFQVSLTLFGSGSGNTFSDFNGFYSFSGLQDGTYNIVPSKTGYTFLPPLLILTVNGSSLTGQNFMAYPTAPANLTTLDSADFAQPPEGRMPPPENGPMLHQHLSSEAMR